MKIRPGEEGVTTLLTLHSLGKGAATVFLGTAAQALFLAVWSAEFLPYSFVATAVITALTGMAFRRLRELVTFPALMIGILVALLLTLSAFQSVLSAAPSAAALFLLLIFARLIYFVMDLEFWAMATALLDVRQGKRLFGLVGSGDSVSRILGAFSVPFLIPLIGVERLILISIAGLVGCLVVQIATFRLYGHRIQVDDPLGEEERSQSQAHRGRSRRYVLLISLVVLFGVLARYLVDYAFLHQAQDRLGGAEQIAVFLGWFVGFTQVVSLLIRIFVSGRLLGRFGVGVGLLVLPISQLACTGLMIASGIALGVGEMVFWLVVANQGLVKVFKDTIDNPSLRVLYQPLRARERLAAQITIEMIVHPATTGVAGGLMLAAIPYQPVPFGFLLAAAFGLWILAVLPTFRGYSAALGDAVRRRTIDEGEVLLADRASLALLHQRLASEHPGDVIFALEFLEKVEDPELPRLLVELLEHPDLRVRLHVLGRLEVSPIAETLPALRRRLQRAEHAEERRIALRVLAMREEASRLEAILRYLDADSPELRGAALTGLLRRQDGSGNEAADAELRRLLADPRGEVRQIAARALGELGPGDRSELLYRVLGDVEPEVRRTAIAAAGHAYSPALWPGILDSMASPAFCSAATTAILVAGRVAVPQIDSALERIGLDRPVQMRLVRLCGRLRGNQALGVLRRMLHEPDQALRQQVQSSLVLCRYRARAGRDRDDVREELRKEAAESTWRLAALLDLAKTEAAQRLVGALQGEITASRRRIFLLLSFLLDPATLLGARDSYDHSSQDRRAYALEILDVVLPREVKPWLLPLFDELDPQERITALGTTFPQQQLGVEERLREILTAPPGRVNNWTRCCALLTAGSLRLASLGEILRHREDLESVPLTRETRRWAVARIEGGQAAQGAPEMSMPTMEKVMVLKSVSIFADTSEEVLAEAAGYLEEIEVAAGDPVFSFGEVGDSMYIVIRGRVRCHIDERILTDLGEREIFGELAVLDPEPRSATVTALEDTYLFRLGRDAFFELVADHVEVARGVFQVLCRRLRRATA